MHIVILVTVFNDFVQGSLKQKSFQPNSQSFTSVCVMSAVGNNCKQTTKYTMQTSSRESNSSLPNQRHFRLLWDPRIQYCARKTFSDADNPVRKVVNIFNIMLFPLSSP
jgi:hypothetical protein